LRYTRFGITDLEKEIEMTDQTKKYPENYKEERFVIFCPHCGAKMRGSKYDPQHIDELEMMDLIFGD
jgi:hypothetical protein